MGLRRVSVNSFGFGGSNTHVVLDDAMHYLHDRGLPGNHCTARLPRALTNGTTRISGKTNGANGHTNGHTNGVSKVANGSTPALPLYAEAKPPTLLVWTAADEKAVARTVAAYETYYTDRVLGHPGKLESLAFTLAARRSRMLWRTYAVVAGADGVLPKRGEKSLLAPARATRSSASGDLGLAFVFTGQGAQYVDMGWDLVQFPVFAETLRRIDEIYRGFGCEWSIFNELRNKDNIDKPEYSQPLSTAVQIALLELLKSFGVLPKAVLGHSSGEIGAA